MRQYDLLVRAAELAATAVQAVRPDQHARPTPCADWDVRALIDHLADVALMSERAATRRPDVVSADFLVLAKRLTGAWSDPGAWEGTTLFGGTFAVNGGIRPAARFDFEMEDPVLGRTIRGGYEVAVLPVLG